MKLIKKKLNKLPAGLKRTLENLAALAFGFLLLAIILFMIETGLRFMYKDASKFYYSFDTELLNHAALFKRSLVPKETDSHPKVFCLGGSTTNGCNMPIPFSYPNLLDSLFRRNNVNGTAYNYGISGVNSVTTNSFIKNLLPKYGPDCVVIHDGYNDLPVVIRKLGNDKYSYIKPDYEKAFNPHIKNPVVRYITSFIKFNLRATRRFVITFVKKRLKRGGDLFLGFDYKKYPQRVGTAHDILLENKARLEVMLKYEFDSIEYCLANNIKVIIILEPYIKPGYFAKPYSSGFRDIKVGEILSECHKIQQSIYLMALISKYKDEKNLKILDLRQFFIGKYDELFYDECHLNGKGNAIKAQLVYKTLESMFEFKTGGR